MLDPIVNFFTRDFPVDRPRHRLRHRHHPVAVPVGRPLVHAARLDPEGGARPDRHRHRRPLRLFLLRHPVLEGLRSRTIRPASWQVRRPPRRQTCWRANRSPLPPRRRPPPRKPAHSRLPAQQTCKRSEIAAMSRRSRRFQRQPQCVDFVDAASTSSAFSAYPGATRPSSTTRPPSSSASTRSMRRTTTELVDTLGRARGTSRIDQNLQDARDRARLGRDAWYIGLRGPTRRRPASIAKRSRGCAPSTAASRNARSTFDARADNLLQFLDRIAGDMGSTSDILRSRSRTSNAGWFDPRADDRFWFAYGQLYAYYGILDRRPRRTSRR